MSVIIKDGTGAGNTANVDDVNRLHTACVSRSELDAAIADGRYFVVNSGIITLTSATETPILYIKNNDDRLLYLDIFIITTGATTSGTGEGIVRTYGVTPAVTSDIITNAVAGNVANANLSSANTFNGLVYKGADGDTISGGSAFNQIIIGNQYVDYKVQQNTMFAKGNAGIYTYQPPASNTSQKVIITTAVYFVDKELPA